MIKKVYTIILLILMLLLLNACDSGKRTITFDFNCEGLDDYKCFTDKNNKIDCTLELPSCNGYTFVGWYDSKDGENLVNLDNDFLNDTTIYAKWNKDKEIINNDIVKEKSYTITFDLNGGKGVKINNIQIKNNEVLPRITNQTPYKDGYIFMGWFDNKDYTKGNKYYNELNKTDKKFNLKKNITLYAGWKKKKDVVSTPKEDSKKYTVSFDSNNGNGIQDFKILVEYDKTMPSISDIVLTNPGYTFMGWYDNKNYVNGEQYYDSQMKNIRKYDKKSDTILYAGWTPNKFSVTYYPNGGNGTTQGHKCTYDSSCTLSKSGYTKSGYTFAGWKKDNTGNVLQVGTSIKNIVTSGEVKYYAVWTPNKFSVTYYPNGAEGTTQGHKCTYDSSCTLSKNGYTKSGYTFAGWKKDNTGSVLKEGTSIKNIVTSGEVKYYAQWTKNGKTLKVASFNIGYFSCGSSTGITCEKEWNVYSISNYTINKINEKNIDIIGLQEARDNYNSACKNNGGYCYFNKVRCGWEVEGLTRILRSQGLNPNDSTELNKHFLHSCPDNANAIYSKYVVKDRKTTVYTGDSSRTIDKVVVNVNGVDISFYNTHLSLKGAANISNFEQIASIASSDPNPIIITGDFNYRQIDRYNTYLKNNGFIIAAHDDINHNMNNGPHYMDSVFVRPYGSNGVNHINVVSHETVDAYAKYSDHNMIIATLSVY